MTKHSFRVAIFQNTLTGGGRIRVVNEIIAVLNQLGVSPDIFTFRVNPSFREEPGIHYRIVRLPQIMWGFYEIKIVLLNYLMRFRCKGYDLLINSNNSLLFAPTHVPTVSYIYFPREIRVLTDLVSLAFPDGERIQDCHFLARGYRKFLRFLYRRRQWAPLNRVVADSQFTRKMFLRAYSNCRDVTVVYPPVDLRKWRARKRNKQKMVTTLGRFSPEKRQLEQIQIAGEIPELPFHIIGFVGDRESQSYYQKCDHYIARNQIQNVFLHKNLSGEETVHILQESQFFLHNLRNEPFGLSTVEAIAAGCVPLVPDSGGQMETVPIAELRFQNREDAVQKLKRLQSSDLTAMREQLTKNLQKFSMERFHTRMKRILSECLFSNKRSRVSENGW